MQNEFARKVSFRNYYKKTTILINWDNSSKHHNFQITKIETESYNTMVKSCYGTFTGF